MVQLTGSSDLRAYVKEVLFFFMLLLLLLSKWADRIPPASISLSLSAATYPLQRKGRL
jgi:hypothetical protein